MKTENEQTGVIEAPVGVDKIRNVYNLYSKIYFLAGPLEKKARMRGLDLARIMPKDKVLEVAVGIGYSFLEILKRVEHKNIVYGIDLSPAMLEKTAVLVND